jgi:flavin reductase (DIM6/NTAB) family NADH-FMN oxidoreductase RutF
MFYDATRNDHGFEYDPFKALVAPRPIGWISSLSPVGVANLAPYSYFNAMSQDPHYVVFGTGPRKDSIRNIEAAGEFAVNLATWELREQMNLTSAHVAPHVDEFELARLSKAPCRMIKTPRVADSPVCLECKLFRVIELPGDDGHVVNWMTIGRVIGIYIDDQFIENGRVNTAAMKPIARLGYSEYATVEEAWWLRRPG